jgi:hypothetical protein
MLHEYQRGRQRSTGFHRDRFAHYQLPKVKPGTAARVRKAIVELNFYPNTHARTLVSGRSRIVVLIISDITNPFFPELVKSFEVHLGIGVSRSCGLWSN